MEKIIVKKDKDELLVFWINDKSNYGFICCTEVLSEHCLYSMSEASLDYFHSCKKATEDEIELALKAVKNVYRTDCEASYKLSQKDISIMWSKVA